MVRYGSESVDMYVHLFGAVRTRAHETKGAWMRSTHARRLGGEMTRTAPSERLTRIFPALALLLALAALPSAATSVRAQDQETGWRPPRTVYVPATGHTVDGLFLTLWREQPDLLGDPITEEFEARTPYSQGADDRQIVQYFERVALVYLPDEAPGEQVALLPLGRDLMRTLKPRYPAAFRPLGAGPCGAADADACRFSKQTRHTVRDAFLGSWEGFGGETMLGHPLSEPFRARDGRTVQVFENGALQQSRSDSVTVRPVAVELARSRRLDTAAIARPADVPTYDASLFVEPAADLAAEDDVAVGGEDDATDGVDDPLAQESGADQDGVSEDGVSEDGITEDGDLGDVTDETDPSTADDESAGELDEPVAPLVGPGPQQGGGKEIVISISAQTLWAYEGAELVVSTLVSTGTAEVIETTTPIGYHSILTKYDVQTMEGTISNEYYRVEDVPNVMYFDNLGNAIHGAYWHDNFGTPMSHGCVNVPLDIAAFLYAWAPIGTAVTVVA